MERSEVLPASTLNEFITFTKSWLVDFSATVLLFREADFDTFLQFVIDKQGDSRDSIDELEKSFKLFDLGKTTLTVYNIQLQCYCICNTKITPLSIFLQMSFILLFLFYRKDGETNGS